MCVCVCVCFCLCFCVYVNIHTYKRTHAQARARTHTESAGKCNAQTSSGDRKDHQTGLEKQGHSEKLVICYQFRTDVPTYGHGPQYKADNDAAENERCVQKCHFCAWCLLLPQSYGQLGIFQNQLDK
jgi:hypothetical protein